MSRPWMPLYIGDYKQDTGHLGALEHGAYLMLIMHYWQVGSVPDDDRQLARIACCTPAEWRKIKDTIKKLFKDGWHHKRVEKELSKANDISSKRKAAAEQRHSKPDAIDDANAGANGNAKKGDLDTQLPSQLHSQSPEELKSLSGGQAVKRPRHGAISADKRFVYFKRGTTEFAAYSADFQEAKGEEPEATADGRWFRYLGENAGLSRGVA